MTGFFDRALETLPPDALRARQWARLQALARAVLPANPFMPTSGGPPASRIRRTCATGSDFARLPFTRKSELVADQAAHPPFGRNLTYRSTATCACTRRRARPARRSAGSTPQESWDWWLRCWGFVLRGAGLGPGDRVFFPFSFGLFVGFWAGFEGARALGALAIPGGGQDTAQRLATLESLGATAVCCTPSYALHLAQAARERGVDLARLGMRATVHAGEPGAGIPSVRARIEEGWGARAYDHAGMTEMGAYGYRVRRPGRAARERVGVHRRGCRPRDGRPRSAGELVLTNLGRTGSPLLRYRTGDRVRVASSPCPCGRTFLRLAGGILGRVDDMLIVRGVNVFPGALEGIVRRFPAVDEFMIEVYRRHEMDEVRLLVEVADGAGRDLPGRVQEAVRIELGIRVEAVPVPARSLPR